MKRLLAFICFLLLTIVSCGSNDTIKTVEDDNEFKNSADQKIDDFESSEQDIKQQSNSNNIYSENFIKLIGSDKYHLIGYDSYGKEGVAEYYYEKPLLARKIYNKEWDYDLITLYTDGIIYCIIEQDAFISSELNSEFNDTDVNPFGECQNLEYEKTGKTTYKGTVYNSEDYYCQDTGNKRTVLLNDDNSVYCIMGGETAFFVESYDNAFSFDELFNLANYNIITEEEVYKKYFSE